MPAAFFGHGTPMNALERNRYTEAWRTFGAEAPRPRAILVVSASFAPSSRWYSNGFVALIDSCTTGMSAAGNARTSTDTQTIFWATYHSPEMREGMVAFMEKREPSWIPPDA